MTREKEDCQGFVFHRWNYCDRKKASSGINKKMSWHTFRHTFSSILKSNGEDVNVVQELFAALHFKDDAGHLHPSSQSAQAGGPEQGCGYDTAKGECIFCVSR